MESYPYEPEERGSDYVRLASIAAGDCPPLPPPPQTVQMRFGGFGRRLAASCTRWLCAAPCRLQACSVSALAPPAKINYVFSLMQMIHRGGWGTDNRNDGGGGAVKTLVCFFRV